MTRALTVTCLSLLLVGIGGSAVLAKPTIAVLGLEVLDKSGTPTAVDTQVASELTSNLRSRAKVPAGPYQLAPGSDKELIDEKLLRNCDDENKVCMSAIGAELGADVLMYGSIQKSGGAYQVTIVLLDVRRKQREKSYPDSIPLSESQGAALQGWARKIYSKLTGQADSCTIAVKTSVERGTILIDGDEKGNITNGVGQVNGLSEGRYKVAVEAKDYHRWEKSDVTCTAGQTTTVPAELTKNGTTIDNGQGPGGGTGDGEIGHTGTTSSHSSNRAIWKAMAIGGVVGTAISGGVWVYGFKKTRDAQGYDSGGLDLGAVPPSGDHTKSDYTDAKCGTSDGDAAVSRASTINVANQKFADGCSGHKYTVYGTIGTIGFGLVAAIGIVMYASSHDDEKPVTVAGRRTKKQPFAIVPVVGPNGGGATFAMEW